MSQSAKRSNHLTPNPRWQLIRRQLIMTIITTIILTAINITPVMSRCVMNGTCGFTDNSGGSNPVPCQSDHDPQPVEYSWIDEDTREQFKLLCPHLDTDKPLCCNHEQVDSMVDSMMNAPKQLLGRCPSCYTNFAALFCSITCDPNQSDFVRVVKSIPPDPGDEFDNGQKVDTIQVSIAKDWPDRLYHSCKDIDMSGLGNALIVMGCDGNDCNGHKLVEALGSRDKAPFVVNYNYVEGGLFPTPKSGQKYMNVSTYTCDIAPIGSFDEFACSCADCRDSCAKIEDVTEDECSAAETLLDLMNDPVEEALRPLLGSRIARITVMMVIALIVSGVALIIVSKSDGGTAVSPQVVTPFKKRVRVSSKDANGGETVKIGSEWYTPIASNGAHGLNGHSPTTKCNLFDSWTRIVCRYPYFVMITGFLVIVGTSSNLVWLKVVNDPVSLWSSPNSRSRIEKSYFDDHFGPFFRIQQVIVSSVDKETFGHTFADGTNSNVSALLKPGLLDKLLDLENNISSIIVNSADPDTNGTSFPSICHAPLSNGRCVIQSSLNYFQSSRELLHRSSLYLDHMRTCLSNPVSPLDEKYFNVPCLAAFGGPAFPNVVFGGFSDSDTSTCGQKKNGTVIDEPIRVLSTATSVVITFLVGNHRVGTVEHKRAVEWEGKFLSFMEEFISENRDTNAADTNIIKLANQSLSVTFFSERSMEDEIKRQSDADVPIVATSYFLMFCYICITLGQYTNKSRILVDSKIGMGLAGIFISFASVSAAIGITAVIGIDATPIAGVLPFMLLYVGVNNVFVLVQSFQRAEWIDESLEDRMARTVSDTGPSILLSVIAQSACFLIGSLLASMPATFALNAGLALIMFIILFFTFFISVLYLDTKRQLDGRLDILACIQVNHGDSNHVDVPLSPNSGNNSIHRKSIRIISSTKCGQLFQSIAKYFIPKSRGPRTFLLIVTIFSACLTVSLLPELNIGLEQEVSVPDDSNIAKYFRDQRSQLKVGAPVYFVLKSAEVDHEIQDGGGGGEAQILLLDFNSTSGQNVVCGDGSCFNSSLSNVLRKRSREHRSRITGPVNSWLDDYLAWVSSASCCRTFNNDPNTFCPSTLVQDGLDRSKNCSACDGVTEKRPGDFYKYIQWFLSDDPTRDCSVGGHAQYSSAISFMDSTHGTAHNDGSAMSSVIEASWFMAYHKPASVSEDFAASLVEGRELAKEIEATFKSEFNISAEVFPYSVFYVFYEQYLNIWRDAMMALSTSLLTILAVVLISNLSGHLINALIFLFTLISFLIHLMGFMWWWNISLNALSLVNLVMACGLSVEFCSHVLVAFSKYQAPIVSNLLPNGSNLPNGGQKRPSSRQSNIAINDIRTQAAISALRTSGSSVLCGIAATISSGLFILAFARSKIFNIYYFRMYLGIGIFGSFHGLFILPILLSLFGRVKGHGVSNCNGSGICQDSSEEGPKTDESSLTVTVDAPQTGSGTSNHGDGKVASNGAKGSAPGQSIKKAEDGENGIDSINMSSLN